MVSWQSLAYCICFENRRARKGSRGSNPLLTATISYLELPGLMSHSTHEIKVTHKTR